MIEDRPAGLGRLATWAAERHGSAPAIRFRRDGEWTQWTYRELAERVCRVTAGLRSLGVRPGDRVALLSQTRPEWSVCDLAVAAAGAITVPVYPTSAAAECQWVLRDSGASVLIVETGEHLEMVSAFRSELPDLEHIVTIDETHVLAAAEWEPSPDTDPDAPVTIVYTSGTTGNPKGCQLSYRNVRTSLDAIETATTLGPGDAMFLYLPLAHLFARMVQIVTFEHGATLVYFDGPLTEIVSRLAETAPTHLPSVPRLFEKVYSTILGMIPDEKRAAVANAVDLGVRVREAREPISAADERAFADAEAFLYAPVRAAFGGRIREALTGAAPVAPEILRFFTACGVPILEAYGMTESAALITANVPGAVRIGTVGRPLGKIEVRIAADGEVLSRGANTFIGYWHNDAATTSTVVDGWLHTGDLGALDEDGFLTITGRKKDIIITSGGKNLTPANVESDLRRCRWISQAVMCGDRRPYPVALITLDEDEVFSWARARELVQDVALIATDPAMRELIADAVRSVNQNYTPPSRIRDFAVLPTDFTIDDGELTPTLKIKRATIVRRYAGVLDALYDKPVP